MPAIYSKHHDEFVETFVNTNESKVLNKERLVFGKTKSNYIFPVTLLVTVK